MILIFQLISNIKINLVISMNLISIFFEDKYASSLYDLKGENFLKNRWVIEDIIERMNSKKKIASVKTAKSIDNVLKYKNQISAVFLITGSILTIKKFVDVIQNEGIPVFIHAEKVNGLNLDKDGLDFLAKYVKPAGILTTKTSLIKKAKEQRMLVVQRVFMIDTEVYQNVLDQHEVLKPDFIEIMPSTLYHVIHSYSQILKTPIITGGLLSTEEQALAAIKAGAFAVSTTNEELWKKDFTKGLVEYKEHSTLY